MRGSRDRSKRLLLVVAAVALLLAILPASSSALLIRQIHPSNAMFGGDWVELQFTADGESVVGKHILTYFSTGGTPNSDYLIPGEVANAQSQRTVLLSSVFTPAGESADFTGNVELLGGDGAVCLTGPSPALTPLDCVSYGNFTASGFPTGTPAARTEYQETLQRTIARGCATALDAADDTNNSATDFALTTDLPRNNATVPTEKTCSGPGSGGTKPPPGSNFKCQGAKATLIGTDGKDKITGTNKRDVIVSFGGNDKVNGGGGNDVLCGNGGKDKLTGGKGKDLLVGGPKSDKLIGGPGKDTLSGQGGNDTCNGGPGPEVEKSC